MFSAAGASNAIKASDLEDKVFLASIQGFSEETVIGLEETYWIGSAEHFSADFVSNELMLVDKILAGDKVDAGLYFTDITWINNDNIKNYDPLVD